MSFFVWLSTAGPGQARLASTYIEDVERLHFGETVPQDFGQPIEYQMSDLFPDDIALVDNYSVAKQIVVSRKLRKTLETLLPNDSIQYLPVKILNHKGRVAATDYSIMHPHRVVDCIDMPRSGVEWNPLNPDKIMGCDSLVLDAHKIPPDAALFRLKHWGSLVIATAQLVKQLDQSSLLGMRFVESTEYTGVG